MYFRKFFLLCIILLFKNLFCVAKETFAAPLLEKALIDRNSMTSLVTGSLFLPKMQCSYARINSELSLLVPYDSRLSLMNTQFFQPGQIFSLSPSWCPVQHSIWHGFPHNSSLKLKNSYFSFILNKALFHLNCNFCFILRNKSKLDSLFCFVFCGLSKC